MGSVTKGRVLGALVAVGVAMAAAVSAHHSQSAYEPSKTIQIEGTMQAISWANPHSLFFVSAKLVGTTAAPIRWSVEGPAPRALEGAGWMRTDIKIGDKVTMTGRPRRDGKPDMIVVGVVTAAGKNISFRNDGAQ